MRPSDELFTYYALHSLFSWTSHRQYVIHLGGLEQMQKDLVRIISALTSGRPYLPFDSALIKDFERKDYWGKKGRNMKKINALSKKKTVATALCKMITDCFSSKSAPSGGASADQPSLQVKENLETFKKIFESITPRKETTSQTTPQETQNNARKTPFAHAKTGEKTNVESLKEVCNRCIEKIAHTFPVPQLGDVYFKLGEAYRNPTSFTTVIKTCQTLLNAPTEQTSKPPTEQTQQPSEQQKAIEDFYTYWKETELPLYHKAHKKLQEMINKIGSYVDVQTDAAAAVFETAGSESDPRAHESESESGPPAEGESEKYLLERLLGLKKYITTDGEREVDEAEVHGVRPVYAQVLQSDSGNPTIIECGRVFDELMGVSMFGYYAFHKKAVELNMHFVKYFEEAAAKEAKRNTKIETIEDLLRDARNGVNIFKGNDNLKKTFETKLTEFKTAVEAWKQMELEQGFDNEYYRLNRLLCKFNTYIEDGKDPSNINVLQ